MASALYESLSLDMPSMAKMLQSKGRGKDRILAHITPKEAALLKKRGGRGSRNPDTGLLEFDDGDFAPIDTSGGGITTEAGLGQTPAQQTQTEVGGGGYSAPITDTGAATSYAPSNISGGIDFNAVPSYQGGTNAGVTGLAPGNIPSTGITYGAGAGGNIPTSNIPTGVSPFDISQTTPVDVGTTTGTSKTGGDQSVLQKLTSLTGLSTDQLSKLGLAGGVGLLGYLNNKKAQNQINQAAGQEQAIAAPYQQQGQQLISQATRGELTPESMQAYQAAQAQVKQGIANSGGVGVTQAANTLANIYQTLLNNQYNYGLQVSQIGDQYALGAIQTQQQMDQQLAQVNQNFYAQMAGILAGTPTLVTQRSATTA